MKTITRTRCVGGSLMVTIPNEIVKEESLQENEVIEITITKIKRSGFGMLKGIGKFTEKDELNVEL